MTPPPLSVRSTRADKVTVPMLVRARRLVFDAGLSFGAAAAVVSLDWGKVITAEQLRFYLRESPGRRGVGLRNPGAADNFRGATGARRYDGHTGGVS